MDALSQIFDDIHLTRAEYFYYQPKGQWQFRAAPQDQCVIYIFLQGNAHIYVDDENQLNLNTGDIAILPSGHAHVIRYSATETIDPHCPDISLLFAGHRHEVLSLDNLVTSAEHLILCIRCHMDQTMAKPLIQSLPHLMRTYNVIGTGAPPWLEIGLNFFALENANIRPGRDTLIDRLVGILFIEGVRDYIEALNDQNNWLSAINHPELSNALAAIHGQPEYAWTVAELAQVSCMSRSKFAESFSQIMGEPPLSYLAQHRLRLASRYLRESALHIHQIALRIGYTSETAFSQAFKRQFQLTPSQYRQQHLSQQ